MTKCNPKYKNLNEIQSFSDQRYATVQLMEQICRNDEYLKQYCERLNYLSPPAVRKSWLNPSKFIDEQQSWGYEIGNDNQIRFSSKHHETFYVDFNEESLSDSDRKIVPVNKDQTTAQIITVHDNAINIPDGETYESTEGSDDYTSTTVCRLPTHEERHHENAVFDFSTRNFKSGDKWDSAWYVGFNKSKNYYVRPDWLKDWRDFEIPSVVRAQTFKAKTNGTLVAVSLALAYNGSGYNSNAGCPLYVQIWPTHKRTVRKIKWDSSTNNTGYVWLKDNAGHTLYPKRKHYRKTSKGKYVEDKKGDYVHDYETVVWPGSKNAFNKYGKIQKFNDRYHPLAQAVYDPGKQGANMFPTITLDTPIKVKKGYSYAIVLFSPLTEWKHCPRWCGWGRNSVKDKYADGMAFFSEKNGYNFKRHGASDLKRKYKLGKYSPADFAFQCHIRTKDEVNSTTNPYNDGVHYLYLEPIITNPITHIQISAQDSGDTTTDNNINIQYQYSTDGRTWTPISTSKQELAEPSKVLFFRALLWKKEGVNDTPEIQSITIDLDTQLPEEMYVRTPFYTPSSDTILGANVWGRIYAPFTTDPSVECTVEIIENTTPMDHFTIIELDDVEKYMTDYDMDVTDITGKDTSEIAEYLTNHYEVLEEFKKYNIYLQPKVIEDYLYKFSFTPDGGDMKIPDDGTDDTLSGLVFTNQVASPILECILQPQSSNFDTKKYSEWIHFDFDYTNNTLIFDKDVLLEMNPGDLAVSYNRVFIDGLTSKQVGVHIDESTGLKEEGLILDYFKEKITITDEQAELRRVKLKVNPVDPIREVILNKDTDYELELKEGFDFNLDTDTNELEFVVNSDDGVSSVIKANDELQVVYTPNLNCNGIAIGYHAKRIDTSKQVAIKGSYIEYKV